MPSIVLQSPAKLNLVLDLLHKRPDGFHEVEIIFQEVELHDVITIETIPHSSKIQLECTDASVPLDSSNTCWKAVELMQEELQKQHRPIEGVRVFIEKHIPAAGGLGGGSSNAAAVLKGLNELWKLHLSHEQLALIAGKIGSDVPFLIYGGTCIGRGKGELITPLREKCPKLQLAFIVPPVKVPAQKTKWVFGNFNVANIQEHPSIVEMQEALKKKDPKLVVEKMGNVFETLTLKEYDPVFELIAKLNYMDGIQKAMLAGAGPTVVAVCENERIASQVVAAFRMQGWVAFATSTH